METIWLQNEEPKELSSLLNFMERNSFTVDDAVYSLKSVLLWQEHKDGLIICENGLDVEIFNLVLNKGFSVDTILNFMEKKLTWNIKNVLFNLVSTFIGTNAGVEPLVDNMLLNWKWNLLITLKNWILTEHFKIEFNFVQRNLDNFMWLSGLAWALYEIKAEIEEAIKVGWEKILVGYFISLAPPDSSSVEYDAGNSVYLQ
jgi:hypothetical protein